MIDIFNKYHIKHTINRENIYKLFLNNDKLSIKYIINNLKIDSSTIYRIINIFLEKNIIKKIIIENNVFYTICNDNSYLECIKCHNTEIIDLKGFKLDNMKGICHNCQIKKGIFVGSFNPPTKAHFQIGHYLYNNHYLDEIIYVPVNSIKKNNINITDRVNMINLYIKDYPYLKINNIEVINGNKNFSYKDMNTLKEEYKSDLYIIMGADNFNDLINYDNYEYLLKNYYFMIINRNNINIEEIINNHYLKYKNKFTIINFNNDISSTKARNNINENYLDKKIIDYIKSNDLYSK